MKESCPKFGSISKRGTPIGSKMKLFVELNNAMRYNAFCIMDQVKASRSILIVDDETTFLRRFKTILEKALNLRVEAVTTIEEAQSRLSTESFAVVVLDQYFDKVQTKFENGITAIPMLLSKFPDIKILVHTSSGKYTDAVKAIKGGATGYIFKAESPNGDLLVEEVKMALEEFEIDRELEMVREGAEYPTTKIKSKSPVMKTLLKRCDQVATAIYPVLLLGETGVGKTYLAKHIHVLSGVTGPFIEKNLSTLSEEQIESTLFGSVKGSYTGSIKDRKGVFEIANNGTLFIDEIGDLSLNIQNKILTAIESKKFSRMGEPEVEKRANFRLICATNKNPKELIETGRMKHDFYARIRSYELMIPSLSERSEDIPDIIREMLPEISAGTKVRTHISKIPEDFIEWLRDNPPAFNYRGIRDALSKLLSYSVKDKRGRPDYSGWREIEEFKGIELARRQGERLTWRDVVSSEVELLTTDFPGCKSFFSQIEEKLIKDGEKIFSTTVELAKKTGISKTTLFRRGYIKDPTRISVREGKLLMSANKRERSS